MDELDTATAPLTTTITLEPSKPLWKRAPVKDENGELLVDFMMLIPKLNKQNKTHIQHTINKLNRVLAYYSKTVVFADLNLKINVLWISIRPARGLCIEIPAAIRSAVPEAVLISDHHVHDQR